MFTKKEKGKPERWKRGGQLGNVGSGVGHAGQGVRHGIRGGCGVKVMLAEKVNSIVMIARVALVTDIQPVGY